MSSNVPVRRLTLALLCALILTQFSVVGEPAATANGRREAGGEMVIGVILAVRGNAEIRRVDGSRVVAEHMGQIRTGDVIAALLDARVQIRFSDGSMIILEENTTLEIFQYGYHQDGISDAMLTKLNSGTIHVTTGMIAVRRPENVYTLTPVARVALDPAAHRKENAGIPMTDDLDAVPARPAFYSITATYDSTTTLFITGAAIIVYSKAGTENMSVLGRSHTVTEPGVAPEAGGAFLPGVDTAATAVDDSKLPRSREYLSGYAVGVLDGDEPLTMEILSNGDTADFYLDNVVEQEGQPTTVASGAMSLTLGPNITGGEGGGAPASPVIDFVLGGESSVAVADPELILQSGEITVAGTTDYLGWGNWQATFVNPADDQDTKTYNGVWSATAFTNPTPEAYISGLTSTGTYHGAALCVLNDTTQLSGTSRYDFDFGPGTFVGEMNFPALQMSSSGTISGNGFTGQIDAIGGDAGGIQSALNGGFFGPQADAINGTFQAGQAGNTFSGVFNGQ